MTSLSKVFSGRFVLGVAFLACACQHDSAALFDDAQLPGSPLGGAPGAAGALATAGDFSAAGDDASGGETGGTAAAGTGGAGKAGESGSAGKPMGGGAGTPSTAGEGGSAGSAMAGGGTGGTKDPVPEPVTIMTSDFADSYVASCINSNFGEEQTLNVDSSNSCVYQVLINPSLAEVPEGALVSQATLTLYCVNIGDALTVSYVDEAWDEDTVRYSTRPEAGAELGDLSCEEMGALSLDLTVAVKAWLSGERAAHGLYLRTEGSDGTDFASSEHPDVEECPTLSVTYILPEK